MAQPVCTAVASPRRKASMPKDQAAELLHQIIVEKARTIYESIVDEEEVDDAAEDKDAWR